MSKDSQICVCGDQTCIGYSLLHSQELSNLDNIKGELLKEHGDVNFRLKDSPSSGEIFTEFYELHMRRK